MTQSQTLVPNNWNELVDNVHLSYQNMAGRLPEDQLTYDQYKQSHTREGIINHVLEEMGDQSPTLKYNDFPYTAFLIKLPQVKQMVFWSKVDLSTEEIDEYLSVVLKGKEYAWFEQPISHKSVPEIFHVHVFLNS